MLLIGSRALRHHLRTARAAKDWDVVGTRDDLRALSAILEPLRGAPWTSAKAYFLADDRPVEFIVADGTTWMDVLARPAPEVEVDPLGRVRVATLDTLRLLKESHLHVTGHFWKTVEDVACLSRHASIAEDDPLLVRLRAGAEGRRGRAACAFGPRLRVLPVPASVAMSVARAEAIRTSCPTLQRHLVPNDIVLAKMPADDDTRIRIVAEAARLFAHEQLADEWTPKNAREILRTAIEVLGTDIFGRDVRIALNRHAPAALEQALRLGRLTVSSSGCAVLARTAFRPDGERSDLLRAARWLM